MEYPNYLYHHGIKGMRWGVRRYQNKDGSLTPAGEKRRARLEAKLDKLGVKKKTAADGDENAKPAKKTVKDMTDDELDKAIVRARKEDEYNRLRPEPGPVEKHPLMKKLVKEAIVPAAVSSGKRFMENALDALGKKVLGGKVDPNSLEALKKTFEKLDYANKIDKLRNPDKYLSEEDKAKRQKREQDKANWDAQQEGYKDAADKATKQREAKAAKAKADADADARSANEATSRAYYESTYNNKGGEKTSAGSGSSSSTALSVINTALSKVSNSAVSALSRTTISTGKSGVDAAMDLIDRNGNTIGSFNKDGEPL